MVLDAEAWRQNLVVVSFPRLQAVRNSSGEWKKKPVGLQRGWQNVTQSRLRVGDTAFQVLTGERSGVTVLDFDATEVFEEFAARFPIILAQPRVATRKGFHVYFEYHPEATMNGLVKIDVLNNGKCAYYPPTKYIMDGATVEYKWVQEGPLAPLPAEVLEHLRSLAPARRAPSQSRPVVTPSSSVPLTPELCALLKDMFPKIHPNYTNLEVKNIDQMGDVFRVHVRGPGSSYCQNKQADHTSEHIYFIVTPEGMRQRCYSGKGIVRSSGLCRDFASPYVPLSEELMQHLAVLTGGGTRPLHAALNNAEFLASLAEGGGNAAGSDSDVSDDTLVTLVESQCVYRPLNVDFATNVVEEEGAGAPMGVLMGGGEIAGGTATATSENLTNLTMNTSVARAHGGMEHLERGTGNASGMWRLFDEYGDGARWSTRVSSRGR